MEIPEIRYVKTGDGVHIAYQELGDGPIDLMLVPGYASNLQWQWELPSYVGLFERLASFSRLIMVDRRGSGLSDRFSADDLPPLEDLVNDLEAVLDAVGSTQVALLGPEDGGLMCAMFAATNPQRVSALVLYAVDPGGVPPGQTGEQSDAFWDDLLRRIDDSWGTRAFAEWDVAISHPSRSTDTNYLDWFEVQLRLAASPGTAGALLRIYRDTDIRGLLPSISAPTLILHRVDDPLDPISMAHLIAGLVPGSTLVELPGDQHHWAIDNDDIADEIEAFLTGSRPRPAPNRVLAAVLFTDIVGSTKQASAIGDHAWRRLIDSHDAIVRRELRHFDGREINTAGDGFLATFEGPARAVRCARAIEDAVQSLDIEIRAGVHIGELEMADGAARGMAVHIGARIAAMAGPSEVLVSSTVKELTAGSGLVFEDRGEHELKGVPDRWHVYAVANERA